MAFADYDQCQLEGFRCVFEVRACVGVVVAEVSRIVVGCSDLWSLCLENCIVLALADTIVVEEHGIGKVFVVLCKSNEPFHDHVLNSATISFRLLAVLWSRGNPCSDCLNCQRRKLLRDSREQQDQSGGQHLRLKQWHPLSDCR